MSFERLLSPRRPARSAAVIGALALVGCNAATEHPAPVFDERPVLVEEALPPTISPAPVVPVAGAPASFADLVESVRPGVVNIYTTQLSQRRIAAPIVPYGRAPQRPRVERSLGSGFVVDSAGHILTNAHVIEGATSIRVVFDDDTELDARIVGVDAATDIAVIRVDAFAEIQPLPLGDSDQLRVGDWTVAVGNPFGLSSTVTAGILSARSRRDVPVGGAVRYVDFLQTDASINPGNSGGPLLDMAGRVIGINTAVNREGQGIAFAIPINMVGEILPQLIAGGRVERSWLGVFIEQIDEDVALAMALDSPEGALITRTVPGGPAAIAGIRPGDVIRQFGEASIDTPDDLKWVASTAGVGETVPVSLLRGGTLQTVEVVMGELPE